MQRLRIISPSIFSNSPATPQRLTRHLVPVLLLVAGILQSGVAQESYPVHPDAIRHPGVPEGKVEGPFLWNSEIYPGTEREYWLYVPQQYEPSRAACVMIVQDGLGRARDWNLVPAMDNLIHAEEMPVTIGIFISPGVVPAPHENAQPRFNRSLEYDGLGDRYARFLIEEILPEVSKRYQLSSDPNDRCLAGASSGGICAFTAAWERPDQFRRVLSTIGTYVGLRGGHHYPTLVRKTEPKPLRIFLQDGSSDLNIYAGDWWVANQDMLSALKFAGYDVKHVWGEGGHNGKHGAAIMPDALRWIWRDHGQPITNVPGLPRRTDLVLPNEPWQLVHADQPSVDGLAVNAAGEVFFSDTTSNQIRKIANDGQVTTFAKDTHGAARLMFGSDRYLYATSPTSIERFDEQGSRETILNDSPGSDLVVLASGGYYARPDGTLWHVDSEPAQRLVAEGLGSPNGIAVSADQTLLSVADAKSRFIESFAIQPDGSLAHRQRYGYLHVPDETGDSGASQMTVDAQGRLYVASNVGLQVLDQLGRVHFIFSKPSPEPMQQVVLAGPKFDTLYVACGHKIFRRRIAMTGVLPWQSPIKPPRPRL